VLHIPAKSDKYVESVIKQIPYLNESMFVSGPIQILIPQVFAENIKNIRKELDILPFPVESYFAHKSNKSRVFVHEAKKSNLKIGVASLQELQNAIDAGFSGKDIECTGIKNEFFIQKAIKYGCLIVIDGLYELELLQKYPPNRKPRILIRISNPFPSHGTYKRTTRFGITKEEFIDIVEEKRLDYLSVEGLHIHFDEYIPENKSLMITELLSLYKHLYSNNIFPKKINLGGGYRFALLDYSYKDKVLDTMEQISFDEIAYAKTILGLEKGRNLKISKSLVSDKLFPLPITEYLMKTLEHNPENIKLIDELNLTLCIEPGYSLLDNCGIIIMRVLGTKQIDKNKEAVIVDGNMYNLSSHMKEWVTDPILITRRPSKEYFSGFILGNLCKEDDLLLDRKVFFNTIPKFGDLLVFVNTAAYLGSFEDTDAILQPKVKNYVATCKADETVLIQSEQEFLEKNYDN